MTSSVLSRLRGALRRVLGLASSLAPLLLLSLPASAEAPQSRFADIGGKRIHYLVAGQGVPVVLLHGYTRTSHMWRPLVDRLAREHLVIAPDPPGFGESSITSTSMVGPRRPS